MKWITRALVFLEGVCLVLTLLLAIWSARSAIAGMESVRLLQVLSPGPQADDLVKWQVQSTWLVAGSEVLWATMAVLGIVALFGVCRLRPLGIHASFLLSGIYVTEILGTRSPGSWVFLSSLVLVRISLAGTLAKWRASRVFEAPLSS